MAYGVLIDPLAHFLIIASLMGIAAGNALDPPLLKIVIRNRVRAKRAWCRPLECGLLIDLDAGCPSEILADTCFEIDCILEWRFDAHVFLPFIGDLLNFVLCCARERIRTRLLASKLTDYLISSKNKRRRVA